jgi:hypothetical protein
MTAATPKRYFNAATNRYYTDPTGTWQPPAGWTQTGLKSGGEVKTKHFDGEDGSYVGGYDWGYDTSGDNSSSNLGFLGGDVNFLGNDPSQTIDPDTYLRAISSGYSDDPFRPPGVPYMATWNAATGQWEERDDEGNVVRYDSAGNRISGGTGPGFDAAGNPIRGQGQKLTSGSGSSTNKTTAGSGSGLSDAWMKALLAAGLGGLAGYLGRQKGITPLGMQGGNLGLSQSQVHGALKGVPVKRAMGGEIDGYAGGGGLHYLKSAEDGMADKIPATIDNKQPAKLSGGEFVIPADVVSHLGNGNSEAGAKRLYEMMDRIRHARTGNKKQGKQINPAKFTPK